MTDYDRRRHAIAFNALGDAIKASGKWMPFTARQAAVNAVLDAIDADARDAARTASGQQNETTPTPCICGHQEQQHIEDVCQVCGCGDYLEPADAHAVIERWRDAALAARAQLAAVGQPAEAQPADEAEDRTTKTTWSVVFQTDSGDTWQEWSKGWRNVADALVSGETVASIATVAEVRFVQTTTVQERFNLHQLTAVEDATR